MVYSVDGIPGTEAVAAQRHLASLLSNKLKWEYLEMCGFVRDWLSLEILRPNTLLLQSYRYKEAYIQQILNLKDESVMALLAPLRG